MAIFNVNFFLVYQLIFFLIQKPFSTFSPWNFSLFFLEGGYVVYPLVFVRAWEKMPSLCFVSLSLLSLLSLLSFSSLAAPCSYVSPATNTKYLLDLFPATMHAIYHGAGQGPREKKKKKRESEKRSRRRWKMRRRGEGKWEGKEIGRREKKKRWNFFLSAIVSHDLFHSLLPFLFLFLSLSLSLSLSL